MNIIESNEVEKRLQALKRPSASADNLSELVEGVFDDVIAKRDQALLEYTERFDHVSLPSLVIHKETINQLIDDVPTDLKDAIDLAYRNIHTFHSGCIGSETEVETMAGVRCWRKSVGIERVGLYIPAGTAPLFSTVLMLGIPAQIAECNSVVLCTPPSADGLVSPAIAYAAHCCGIDEIYTIGGIQAVAAMALGTESVPQVYKIFGPGNAYVTAAKQYAQKYGVAIDMPAGPSEVMIVADATASPAYVAADLLSQAEHGVDSQTILVAHSKDFIHEVQNCIDHQLHNLPRKDVVKQALRHSVGIVYSNLKDAMNIVNEYAPEHLIIAMDKYEVCIPHIVNAGSVFLGHYSPESVGDYASGTNHTLPTAGYARMYSGVSVDSFVKKITFQSLTKQGLHNIAPVVKKMATHEQLDAHAYAVKVREE